jgi:excisionase family DNA binding protein
VSDTLAGVDLASPAEARDTLPSEPEEPVVLTVDELAALLRCNRKTVYAAINRGEIPGVRRLGGAIRIHRDTVLTWLGHGQVRASRSRSSR